MTRAREITQSMGKKPPKSPREGIGQGKQDDRGQRGGCSEVPQKKAKDTGLAKGRGMRTTRCPEKDKHPPHWAYSGRQVAQPPERKCRRRRGGNRTR